MCLLCLMQYMNEELYDVYLSFNAIQELVNAAPQSSSDYPKGFGTLLCKQVNDLEKIIQSIRLIRKDR